MHPANDRVSGAFRATESASGSSEWFYDAVSFASSTIGEWPQQDIRDSPSRRHRLSDDYLRKNSCPQCSRFRRLRLPTTSAVSKTSFPPDSITKVSASTMPARVVGMDSVAPSCAASSRCTCTPGVVKNVGLERTRSDAVCSDDCLRRGSNADTSANWWSEKTKSKPTNGSGLSAHGSSDMSFADTSDNMFYSCTEHSMFPISTNDSAFSPEQNVGDSNAISVKEGDYQRPLSTNHNHHNHHHHRLTMTNHNEPDACRQYSNMDRRNARSTATTYPGWIQQIRPSSTNSNHSRASCISSKSRRDTGKGRQSGTLKEKNEKQSMIYTMDSELAFPDSGHANCHFQTHTSQLSSPGSLAAQRKSIAESRRAQTRVILEISKSQLLLRRLRQSFSTVSRLGTFGRFSNCSTLPLPISMEPVYRNAARHVNYFKDSMAVVQTIANVHSSQVWCMEFSLCGLYLASAERNGNIKVFRRHQSKPRTANDITVNANRFGTSCLSNEPDHILLGHSGAVFDLCWSPRDMFLLSASADRTVRLWHLMNLPGIRVEALCIFENGEFVTSVRFHPKDDRLFYSGCLDGKIRLWKIVERRVLNSFQLTPEDNTRISSMAVLDAHGFRLVAGTLDGRMFVFTDPLQYNTTFSINGRWSGDHRRADRNVKISSISPLKSFPGRVLISSSDSTLRIYDLKLKQVTNEFRGHRNTSSPIQASLSANEKFIIVGSENSWLYIWKRAPIWSGVLGHFRRSNVSGTLRPNKNFERYKVSQRGKAVTCATFAPDAVDTAKEYMLVSADSCGNLRVLSASSNH